MEKALRRKKYNPRRWEGHSYQEKVEQEILNLLQDHQRLFPEKPIQLSGSTMEQSIQVSRSTITKAMKNLVHNNILSVISGKENYSSNTYILMGRQPTSELNTA